ncbi:unnamed protein product [Heligmosomoides polygyrus]|uniref:Thioredoxin-like_fold domain-containing protein n=1 Tax=Heligmosomoides polygyrus TaxID=6339 RepID=A0A183FJ07_HELPZ|nr:unnamed protein product [Heligmosomoides polygyrus]
MLSSDNDGYNLRNAPSFSNINLALTVAVVVLALFYMLLLGRASEERQLSEESLRAKLVDYEKRLAESASKFDTLSDEEFGMLLFLGRQWITMKQKSPAFLVIVGARSEELAIAISDVFRASFMDVEPLTTFNLTSESSRVELHNQISRAAASAVPFAVLNGIDHLYWDAPLVLHALADYSSSEYCNALLLLTITKDFPGTRKECEKSMME